MVAGPGNTFKYSLLLLFIAMSVIRGQKICFSVTKSQKAKFYVAAYWWILERVIKFVFNSFLILERKIIAGEFLLSACVVTATEKHRPMVKVKRHLK